MHLIETNGTCTITSAARKAPKLRCIDGGKTLDADKYDGKRDYLRAVSILEQNMLTQAWFFDQVVAKVDENLGPDGESVKKKLNHDYVVHLAQFFFLFNSIDMTDRNSINAFIDAHNQKIKTDIERKLISRSEREMKKVVFSDARRAKVVESCVAMGRPAFAITELAHFLTDFMSESSATRMIDDLIYAKVLTRQNDKRFEAAENRKLVVSDGFLEDIYAKSLIYSRRGWTQNPKSDDNDQSSDQSDKLEH